MKKMYKAPALDVVKFEYKDQVVADSSSSCTPASRQVGALGTNTCDIGSGWSQSGSYGK